MSNKSEVFLTMNERLRDLRKNKGLSQEQLSKILGISLTSMQNYESGRRELPLGLAKILYEEFRVNPVWLMTGEGGMYHPVEQSRLTDDERELLDLARQSPETMPFLKKALASSRAMAEAVESLKGQVLKEKGC